MKKMFVKVFMNDACGETHDIHEDDVREIEIKIKDYLKQEGYDVCFYYHESSYYGEDFVEVSHEGDVSDEVADALCKLLKGITVEGGFVEDAKELTLNMNNSVKYINFIKIDRCVRL